MIKIQLTQGKIAIIDDDDVDLSGLTWYVVRSGRSKDRYYATRHIKISRSNQFLHRVIVERVLGRSLVCGEEVDHINNDPLDNRRSNLRLVNRSQNTQNARKRRQNNASSIYRGVSRNHNKWQALAQINGKTVYIGTFETPEEAASAYDKVVLKHYGEFARINFVRSV